MNLGLLTLIHGREELTRKVLRYYDDVAYYQCKKGNVTIDGVAVASSEDESWIYDYFLGATWEIRFHENQPLTDKWNYGLQVFKTQALFGEKISTTPIDALMIIGSDNLVHWTTLLLASELCTEENPYWMPAGCFFTDGDRMIYRAFHRVGAGRIVHRSLLERVDWQLWEPGKTAATDGAMDRVLEPVVGRAKRYAGHIIDIKSPEGNMWSFEHMCRPGFHIEVDAAPVF